MYKMYIDVYKMYIYREYVYYINIYILSLSLSIYIYIYLYIYIRTEAVYVKRLNVER